MADPAPHTAPALVQIVLPSGDVGGLRAAPSLEAVNTDASSLQDGAPARSTLHGRTAESTAIDAMLADSRSGRSRSMVLCGPPGIGKTALLDYAAAAAAAAGMPVLRCSGVESEAELAFAALHQLLSPRVVDWQVLPDPQARALRGALGLDAAPSGGDQLMVGLATLSALAELAGERGVVCLVDDLQWIDRPSAQCLLFAARHADAEGIAFFFVSREGHDVAGLPELNLGGLDDDASRALLAQSAPGLDAWGCERVLRECHGVPLALRELGRAARDPGEPFLALPERLQQFYFSQTAGFPPPTRTVLLLAATDDAGDLGIVAEAASALGLDAAAALHPAERSGLVTVEAAMVAFCHPLARTAIYRGASFSERSGAHRALAAVFTDLRQADKRAWHLAAAADRPDEDVAAELELTADRARRRRGYWAAAAALEQAARLSIDDGAKARRLTIAAIAARDAGHPDAAVSLANRAELLVPDSDSQVSLAELRAGIARARGDFGLSHAHYMRAASLLAAVNPSAAGVMAVNALRLAWWTADGSLVAESYAELSDISGAVSADYMAGAKALIALHTGLPREAVRLLRDMLTAAPARLREPLDMRVHRAALAALAGMTDDSYDILGAVSDECRDQGVIRLLPQIHLDMASAQLMLNRFRAAQATASEGLRLAQDMGQLSCVAGIRATLAVVSALHGDEDQTYRLANLVLHEADFPASGAIWAAAQWALALLDLGAGRLEPALHRLEAITSSPVWRCAHAVYFPIAADYIETAARLGCQESVTGVLSWFRDWAEATDQSWALAMAHRCAALADSSADTEGEFRAALQGHAYAGRQFDQARTSLLLGEWLRRNRRAAEARPLLQEAVSVFEGAAMAPWADRARSELRAAGGGPSAPGAPARPELMGLLTPQELQVVRLAASGVTNREIAARLFLSPKTVSHHLYRAFPKLGVTTRTALARLDLPDS